MIFLASVLLALVCILLAPDNALAWGPGVHMAISNQLLMAPGMLGPALGPLLATHPQPFIYGALSADIFVGKGCRARPGHSHNWETALALLETSEADALRAYALGYASHLAADVIAHNYYVPNMLRLSPGSGKLSHVLVEMQADRHIQWCRRQARGALRLPHKEQDKTLLEALNLKRWPFLLKKQLFKSSVRVVGSKELKRSLDSLGQFLPVVPPMRKSTGTPLFYNGSNEQAEALVLRNQQYLQKMLDLSLILAQEAVLQPSVCLALGFDPVGTENLAAVRKLERLDREQRILDTDECFPLAPSLQRFALDLKSLEETVTPEQSGVKTP